MAHLKFNTEKLERLNDPGRFETLSPDVFWQMPVCASAGVSGLPV